MADAAEQVAILQKLRQMQQPASQGFSPPAIAPSASNTVQVAMTAEQLAMFQQMMLAQQSMPSVAAQQSAVMPPVSVDSQMFSGLSGDDCTTRRFSLNSRCD